MLRYKSNKLNKTHGKWYNGEILFDGIIYFCDANYFVESFIVEKGFIKQPYLPICLPKGFSLNAQIDCTDFWNVDYDSYSAGLPQFYPTAPYDPNGKVYTGISYVFKDDICIYEAFNERGGRTGNLCYFNTYGEIEEFELYTYDINNYFVSPELKPDDYWVESFDYIQDSSFSCRGKYDINNKKCIDYIDIGFDTDRFEKFNVSGNILENRHYINCPFPLLEIFELLDNYKNFKMGQTLRLGLEYEKAQALLEHWAVNHAFKETQSIQLEYLILLDNINLLKNKLYFPNLQTVKIFLTNEYDMKLINLNMDFEEAKGKELALIKELQQDCDLDITFY